MALPSGVAGYGLGGSRDAPSRSPCVREGHSLGWAVAVETYRFEDDGTVARDTLNMPIVATVGPNRYAEERVAARRKHLEDYYALIIATHLLAGAEAFVAAQLWDLPARVSIKALPFGPALAATIRW